MYQASAVSPEELLVLQMIASQNLSRVTPALFLDRRELFHSKNGARKSARKIIIVITDGEKYKDPLEYKDVIPEAEKANIIRYAIGVRTFLLAPPDSAFTSPR